MWQEAKRQKELSLDQVMPPARVEPYRYADINMPVVTTYRVADTHRATVERREHPQLRAIAEAKRAGTYDPGPVFIKEQPPPPPQYEEHTPIPLRGGAAPSTAAVSATITTTITTTMDAPTTTTVPEHTPIPLRPPSLYQAPEPLPTPARAPSLYEAPQPPPKPAREPSMTLIRPEAPPPAAAWTKTTKTTSKAHGSFAWGSMAAGAAEPERLTELPDLGTIPHVKSMSMSKSKLMSGTSMPDDLSMNRAASRTASMARAPSMNRAASRAASMARAPSMNRVPSIVAPPPVAAEPEMDPGAVSPRTAVALAAFRLYDVDGSGELDVHEFHKAMQEMGMGHSFEDAENLFNMMDEDGNGVMSLPEFMAHCQEYIRNGNGAGPLSEEQAEAEARKAFHRYDVDGSGFLDVNEFAQAVKDLGLGTTLEDAEALFSMADDDGNGTMECEEFVQHCVAAIQNGGQFREPDPTELLRSKKSLRKKPSMRKTGDPQVDAVNSFKKYDIDDSGYLDIYEFMSAMKELGLGFTFEDAKALFSKIDVDDSGTMDCAEFTEHYLKYCV